MFFHSNKFPRNCLAWTGGSVLAATAKAQAQLLTSNTASPKLNEGLIERRRSRKFSFASPTKLLMNELNQL
jgi:hypothetical protein